MNPFLVLIILHCLLSKALVFGELWCYNCTSNSLLPDSGCEGPNFDSRYLEKCPKHKMYCTVQRTSAIILGYRTRQIIRECTDTYLDRCIYTKGIEMETCFGSCQTDACNGGGRRSINFYSISTILPLLLLGTIWRW